MFGAILGAATSLAGGLLQNKANEKANRAAEAQAQKQYEQQKEFAQSGIQWKVKDAEAAGIHPLYAMGANTISYAPQSVGSNPSDFSFLKDTGQNIGRAIDATRSNPAKMQAFATTAAQLQNEGLALDNDLKRTQLASAAALANQTGTPPGLPSLTTGPAADGIAGQGNSPQIEGPSLNISKKMAPTNEDAQHTELGAGAEVRLVRTKNGWAPVIPEDLSESYEQDMPGRWQWYARNRLFHDPAIQRTINKYARRPGFRPRYNAFTGEYTYKKYPTFRPKKFRELKGYP